MEENCELLWTVATYLLKKCLYGIEQDIAYGVCLGTLDIHFWTSKWWVRIGCLGCPYCRDESVLILGKNFPQCHLIIIIRESHQNNITHILC